MNGYADENAKDALTYTISARERVLRLVDGDIRDFDAEPNQDADIIYTGADLDEALRARDAFIAANPPQFEEQGLSAIVSYHVIEGTSYLDDEDEQEREEPALTATTLTQAAYDRLVAYADGIDEAAEDLGY